jgi:hypothetical protein
VVAIYYLWTTSESFRQFWIDLWASIQQIASTFIDWFTQHFGLWIEGVVQLFQGLWQTIVGIWNVFAGIFTGDWSRVWEGIKGIFGGIWNVIVGVFKMIIGQIKGMATGLTGALLGLFRDGLGRLGGAIWDKLQEIGGFFGDLKDDVVGFFANAGSWLYNAGRSIISGFGDGLRSKFNDVRNSVTGFLGSIRNKFPFSPAKEGPFSGKGWVKYSGISIAEGLAEGMRLGMYKAEAAAEDMARTVQRNMPDGQMFPDRNQSLVDQEFTDTLPGARVVIHQTNYNPIAEPESKQTNNALQVAAALGID